MGPIKISLTAADVRALDRMVDAEIEDWQEAKDIREPEQMDFDQQD